MPSKKNSPNFMQNALNDKYHEIIQKPHKYPIESKWIAPTDSHGIKYISFLGSTGYADAAKNYIRSLVELGIYVSFEPLRCHGGKSGDLLSADDLVLAICLNNSHIQYDTVIIHAVPHYWKDIADKERAINSSVKIFGLTVWETDRVYPKWLNIINNINLDGLIVPSNWNKKIFEDSAKTQALIQFPPVHACHHVIIDRPVAPNLIRTQLYGDNIKVAFLCIGTWTPRKGISETVEAYLQAFEGQSDVILYLKTNSGSYSKQDGLALKQRLIKIMNNYKNPPQIILDTELRSDDYIEALTEHCDVYLSLCNSEGVGLGACSAALKGKIIVMTGYGGQTEYIQNACWIEYKLGIVQVPPNFAEWIRPPQRWAYPNLNHAIQSLQNVHENLKSYKREAMANRDSILNNFSYSAIGRKLISIIKVGGHKNLKFDEQKPLKLSEPKTLKSCQPKTLKSGEQRKLEVDNQKSLKLDDLKLSYKWKPSTPISSESESDSEIDHRSESPKISSASSDDNVTLSENDLSRKKGKSKREKHSKEYRQLTKERHRLRRQRHLERRLYREKGLIN